MAERRKLKINECEIKFDKKGNIIFVKGLCKKKDLQAQFDKIKELLRAKK